MLILKKATTPAVAGLQNREKKRRVLALQYGAKQSNEWSRTHMCSKVFKTLRGKLKIIAILDFTYEISLSIRSQLSWGRGPNEFIFIVLASI